jgi:hypothetical protein
MGKFLEVLLDATIDTAKLVPFLLIVYFLIELLEYKNVFKFENSKLLNGKASPVIGALCGSIPQCGFSVISSELYAKKKISVAALIAVFIATSDESVPIMLSNYKTIPALLLLILTKVVMAILIGYLSMFLFKVFFKNGKNSKSTTKACAVQSSTIVAKVQGNDHAHDEHNHDTHNDHDNGNHAHNEHAHDKHNDHAHGNHTHNDHDEHNHSEHNNNDEHEHIHACCNHDLEENKFNWKHPLIHSAKITIYIFVINILMGGLVAIVGEDTITNFLSSSFALQPLFALLVGLIPNCASSVILTELYLMGGLSFGAIVTGLSVNAGIGFLVLFKENKNIKENLFILGTLVISSLIFGYALHFLPLNFLRI